MPVRIKAEVNPSHLTAVPVYFPRSTQVTSRVLACIALVASLLTQPSQAATTEGEFIGKHYHGRGDTEYLRLLDTARRFFEPDPELQNLAMLYEPKWNGLVEGPTWDAWWIQNSYGTTYSILPFLKEPFITFLQNSQDLWFNQMGDGKRVGATPPFDWIAPDGCLCDAARPGWIVYKQGDGRIAIHDWGLEFTAAGVLMQSELLLIRRDAKAIAHYLPMLERSANFIESRRDPRNNLFLAGPAANLLAPSYAGWPRPDGTFDRAYLTGLSITYIAALDRLIEVEKLSGHRAEAALYSERRDLAHRGLPLVTTPDGYFIRSLDPDGTRHGVFGAERHGYFEASPNHDAIAFRVVDQLQAERIYRLIISIPGLRPHHFILPNFPSYDDMYEKPEGLWGFGTWVNGGHWSTCEARMVLAYYRLSQFEDARQSMLHLLSFAEQFRMDNPLTKCGSDVYQPNQPINLCYDTFGPAAAFMRGLFEYLYRADGLVLVPHVPEGIRELHQLDPVSFGSKRLSLSTYGSGPLTSVRINGRKWKNFDSTSVFLPFEKTPMLAQVELGLGHVKIPMDGRRVSAPATSPVTQPRPSAEPATDSEDLRAKALRQFCQRLAAAGLDQTYEAAHAQMALRCFEVVRLRQAGLTAGTIQPLPEPAEAAAERLYADSATKLWQGLSMLMASYETSKDDVRMRLCALWNAVEAPQSGR